MLFLSVEARFSKSFSSHFSFVWYLLKLRTKKMLFAWKVHLTSHESSNPDKPVCNFLVVNIAITYFSDSAVTTVFYYCIHISCHDSIEFFIVASRFFENVNIFLCKLLCTLKFRVLKKQQVLVNRLSFFWQAFLDSKDLLCKNKARLFLLN